MNATINTDYVSSWKSKGLSAESIKPPTTTGNSLTPELSYYWYQNKNKIYWKLKTGNNQNFHILIKK